MSKLTRFALVLTLCSAGFVPNTLMGADTTPPRDCQDVGGDVLALIDASMTSPNLPAARAAFQHGLALCMGGNDHAANELYDTATEILTGVKPKIPAPQQTVAVVDCRKTGREVGTLIDTSRTEPNIAGARAAYQRGLMECMQGDDAAANELYLKAKALLTSN